MAFPNKILERIKKGEKALGLSLNDPSEELVELAGRMGLDFVDFEGQHAALVPKMVSTLCRIADGFNITPCMRVPDGNESTLLSYLDSGIRQFTVPNLMTKKQAEDLVKFTYFAPLGLRSSTGYQMVMHQDGQDRKEMFDEVNANVIIVPQVENYKTVEILEDILTVDGIDFYGGGAEDMAQSMGLPGGHADPRVDKVYDDMKAKLKAAGKFWYGDYVETVHVTGMTKDGIERLLKDHGRESEMGW
jgi:4-hydroxy-2-oxoheptanedioate aldolase